MLDGEVERRPPDTKARRERVVSGLVDVREADLPWVQAVLAREVVARPDSAVQRRLEEQWDLLHIRQAGCRVEVFVAQPVQRVLLQRHTARTKRETEREREREREKRERPASCQAIC